MPKDYAQRVKRNLRLAPNYPSVFRKVGKGVTEPESVQNNGQCTTEQLEDHAKKFSMYIIVAGGAYTI